MHYLIARMAEVYKVEQTKGSNCTVFECHPPLNLPDPDAHFFVDSKVPHEYSLMHGCDDSFICEIRNGIVATVQGLVFDDTHFFVDAYHNRRLMETIVPVAPYVSGMVQGEVEANFEIGFSYDGGLINLISPHASNYHHWMLELLPKFWAVQMMVARGQKEIALLLPTLEAQFQIDTLKKIIHSFKDVQFTFVPFNANHLQAVKVKELVFPSFIAPGGHSRRQLEWLRSMFLPRGSSLQSLQLHRRIFISRKDSRNGRRLLEEDSIVRTLEDYGFEAWTLSQLAHADQVKLFSEAEIIVGISGAGFTNHIFAPLSAHLIEIHPKHYTNRAHFFTANALGQSYQFTIADGDDTALRIDTDKLIAAVERVI